jgi:hypothetical protein
MRLIGLRPDGDSALWQGMYIWAMLLRHQQLGDRESYQAFRTAVIGLTHLVKISDDPSHFARYIHKSPPSETSADPNVVQGSGIYSGYKYNRRSNNDMAKGYLLGFTIAAQGLEDGETELRKEIGELVKRLRQVPALADADNNGAALFGLDAIWNDDRGSLEASIRQFNSPLTALGDMVHARSGFHIGGITDTSGLHLMTVSNSIQFLMAQVLKNRFGPDERLDQIQAAAASNLKESVMRLQKTHHGYIPLVAFALLRVPALKDLAKEGARSLIEIPLERTVGEMKADVFLQPEGVVSSWPHRPWEAIKGIGKVETKTLMDDGQRLGVYGYPIYEGVGWASTYIWKDTQADFSVDGTRHEVSFSVDYLWAYWLARSSGIIGEKD